MLEQAVPDDVSDGRILISVESLDRWARKKYKFSIKTGRPFGGNPLFYDDSAEANDYGPLKAKNMMVTLALMVDLCASLGPPYSKGDLDEDSGDIGAEGLNFSAMANSIWSRAEHYFGKGSVDVQTKQTIRKLLRAASNELRHRLK